MTVNSRTLLSATAIPAESPSERLARSGGWIMLALALAMLLSVAASLQAANWTSGLAIVQTVVLGGAVLGLLLALTDWGGLFAAVYSLLAGVAWITVLVLRSFIQAPNLHAGITQLVEHNAQWIGALVNGTASGDNLVFVLQLCILGWWLGFFVLWSLVRYQGVWRAVIPAGFALLVNAYYAPADVTPYVIVFLVLALMLAIRVELARNETRWQMDHVRYAPDLYLDFLRAGLIFAIVVIVVSWMMPTAATRGQFDQLLQPMRQPWHQVQDTWQRMFGSLNYRSGTYVSTYGKTIPLGGPVALSDRPVFEAQAPKRSYWRGAAYDTYTGQQWLNTDDQVVHLNSQQPLPEPAYRAMGEMTTTIHLLEPAQDLIFGPPQPKSVNLPVNAEVTNLGVGGGGNDSVSVVSMLRSRVDLPQGSQYQVVSQVTLATPQMLRTDTTSYPAWVRDRYLQVPAELPARVRDLASQLTMSYDSPYDKASAIEAYLRRFPYNTQIAAPPPGEDGVDYFLFDIKEGYCDYYASAMVIMLRTLGIPARFAAGYAPGQQSPDTGLWVVREQDAHAWPEVYFPSYGWVQFEPTAAQPELARPVTAPAVVNPVGPPPPPGSGEDPRDLRVDRSALGPLGLTPPQVSWLDWLKADWWLLGLGAVLAAAVMVAVTAWRRRERRLMTRDSGLVLRLYGLLAGWAERFRVAWPSSQTPLEHARAFSQVLPEASRSVTELAGLYAAQRYGRQQIGQEALDGLAGEWQSLQPVLWRRWVRWLARVPKKRK